MSKRVQGFTSIGVVNPEPSEQAGGNNHLLGVGGIPSLAVNLTGENMEEKMNQKSDTWQTFASIHAEVDPVMQERRRMENTRTVMHRTEEDGYTLTPYRGKPPENQRNLLKSRGRQGI